MDGGWLGAEGWCDKHLAGHLLSHLAQWPKCQPISPSTQQVLTSQKYSGEQRSGLMPVPRPLGRPPPLPQLHPSTRLARPCDLRPLVILGVGRPTFTTTWLFFLNGPLSVRLTLTPQEDMARTYSCLCSHSRKCQSKGMNPHHLAWR